MPVIVNFNLLSVGYFCFSLMLLELWRYSYTTWKQVDPHYNALLSLLGRIRVPLMSGWSTPPLPTPPPSLGNTSLNTLLMYNEVSLPWLITALYEFWLLSCQLLFFGNSYPHSVVYCHTCWSTLRGRVRECTAVLQSPLLSCALPVEHSSLHAESLFFNSLTCKL